MNFFVRQSAAPRNPIGVILASFAILLVTSCSSAPNPPDNTNAPVAATPATTPTNAIPASTTTAPTNDRDRLNGTWKLVSFEQGDPSGEMTKPYTDQAVGRLTLDKAGRIGVFVMKPGRHASVNTTDGVALATPDDLRQIADGFVAYYGMFTVDTEMKILTASVEGATLPAWANSQQKRTYELTDNRLTLITPATKLVWERLSD